MGNHLGVAIIVVILNMRGSYVNRHISRCPKTVTIRESLCEKLKSPESLCEEVQNPRGERRKGEMELWIVLEVEAGECETAVKFYREAFGGVKIHGSRSPSDEQNPLLSVALKFGDTCVIVKEQIEEDE